MRIMACIAAYNSPEDLGVLLNSLDRSQRTIDEVYVVDNSNESYLHENLRLVGQYPDHFVYEVNPQRKKGCAQAFRIGMERFLVMGYDLLLLLDQDGKIQEDSIERYLDHIEEADLIVPKIRNIIPHSPYEIGLLPSKVSMLAKTDTIQASEGDEVIGPNMGLMIHRYVVEQCMYDDDHYFVGFSDFDYGLRTRRFGYRSRYFSDIIVYHPNLSEKYPKKWSRFRDWMFGVIPFQHLGYVSRHCTYRDECDLYSRVFLTTKYFPFFVVIANILHTFNPLILWYRMIRYQIAFGKTVSVYRSAIRAARVDRKTEKGKAVDHKKRGSIA